MAIQAADLLVNVRADVDDARRKIKSLDDDLDRLGGSFDVVGRAARGFGLAATAGFAALTTQAAVGQITAFIGALAPIGGLLAALPGAVAVAGAAFGTLALGLFGVDEAFKHLVKGDMAKYEKALKRLAPEAVGFFRALQGAGPAFSGLRLAVQGALFQGLGFHVNRLARTYIPALKPGMVAIAGGFNAAARAVADFMARADVVMDVKSIFDNTGKSVQSLKNIFPDLAAAFLDFATVGASLMPEFLTYLEGGAEKFRAWADEARKSGQIEEWIRNGATAAKDFGGIILNVGQILGTIGKAANDAFGGETFLANIKAKTQAVEDFLKSADGQTSLISFFTALNEAAEAVGPVLAAAFQAFTQGVVPVLAGLATGVGPGLTTFLLGLKDALITLQPSAVLLGEAVGQLLTNITPMLPAIAEFIAKLIEWAAPLIENEKLVGALVLAFVGMKVIGGALGAANAAIDLFSSKAVLAIGKAIAATATWVASTVVGVASLVYSLGIVAATYAIQGAKAVASMVLTAAQTVAQWVVMAVGAAANTALIVASWVLHSATAAATAVASMVVNAAKVVAQWVVMAVGAAAQAALIVAAWVLHSATAAATAVASMVVAGAKIIAQWALMAARSLVSAAIMATSWLIAMGPIGLVIAAVVGLAILIAKNWDAIKAKTIQVWNAVSEKVSDAWNKVKEVVTTKVAEIVTKVIGLKNDIVKTMQALPAAMLAAGRAAMQGLADGIADAGRAAIQKAKEMAESVKDAVTDFFKINSPSKVFYEIGAFTGKGLANGLKDMTSAVAAAGRDMASAALPPTGAGAGLGGAAAALPGAFPGAGTAGAGASVSVASGAVQVIIQGNVSEATLPQVQSSVDDAFRALLAEINGGRVPGRVA